MVETCNAVGDALFFYTSIPGTDARDAAEWIAGRQGLPGSYAGMFAPTERDMRNGIRLFTGERITSGAATRHITGEEACRTLLLLNSDSSRVRAALDRAVTSIDARVAVSEKEMPRPGFF